MTDSIDMLKSAHQLRDAGQIPEQTAFWAVENPLTNAADRVKQKVPSAASNFHLHLLWESVPMHGPYWQVAKCNARCP